MTSWFDLPWDSIPGDGVSAPISVSTTSDRAENEQLMYAWLRERQENVEQRIYLDQCVQLINRILADGEISARSRRKARHLLLAIRAATRGKPEGTV